uniref:ATP synthase complex subunit 8 n=1 Tax=Iphisa elegans TaxID=88863 RepID=A0A6M8Y6N1_IPHEL|nr:ATP synthase F0 subunit 8 [Iphisa elegans]QKK36736.1 ATP synthase F0 subunit 8 [Iphisa elegans]
MPQLNVSPWLMVFLMTWLALIIYSTKTTKLQEPTPAVIHQVNSKKTAHWQWP